MDDSREKVNDVLTWATDKSEICDIISAHPAFLKIFVKVKDDAKGLIQWLKYYSGIAPSDAIIIFDNCSISDDMNNLYNDISRKYLIIRYKGFQDYIHSVEMFPELYQALSKSCEYFGFFDVDERLKLVRDGKHFCGPEISEFISRNEHVEAFPCTWLEDAICSDTIFGCGVSPKALDWGLAWGKPILKSEGLLKGILLHNVQIDEGRYNDQTPRNLICLHLKNLCPPDRIRSNIAKLIARGVIVDAEEIGKILQMQDLSIFDSNIVLYINEIKLLSNKIHVPPSNLSKGQVKFNRDGTLEYFSDIERDLMIALWAEGDPGSIRRVLMVR